MSMRERIKSVSSPAVLKGVTTKDYGMDKKSRKEYTKTLSALPYGAARAFDYIDL